MKPCYVTAVVGIVLFVHDKFFMPIYQFIDAEIKIAFSTCG
jgi:hypothetical protein